MSHALFKKVPGLRTCTRRTIPRIAQSSYHSSSGPKMQSGSAPLRILFRQTTLRATAIAAQRTSYPLTQQFSQQTYPQQRPRTPSPPPPYQSRNISLLASTSQWTRFTTPNNTLSSVRTFTSTPKPSFASETAPAKPHPSLAPDAQAAVDAAIEEISEMYGTARDEFEIASEESEKNTTYAPDDRAAAREELDKLLEYYRGVIEGDKEVGEEVKRRVGGRIRELEGAVIAMEEKALEHD
ncbi:hypothetical protein T440DRAFT_460591 [Plenodomus tracheiphilus IPT5]|uniref:Uncharacterized protein n=1 Tax=Plenodomus tracheiphilus IPT5 TaxID=1408161 RepID=A0A6A7AQ95_9PLEO|nr:hypothetical protein T440DRAFT_460591 [Plenodomus tracheiphilus IPT5]